ncbi:hypothetical protein [Jiangella asiatica]|uniref:Phage head morphogenesis domain-containing protein n=1 Tax=Jiangella asiatica TaxID=2530372 RepID=A0A4R5CWC7_9ACTN|nr:hypothetical protein [Jiangella asiatica]TDE02844.1 hypothetical protein E1269_21370 [Jiangella asiatica]
MATLSRSRERYAQRQRLSNAVAAEGRRTWRQLDARDVTGSWRSLVPQLLITLSGAQLAAAQGSDEYVGAALAEQGIQADPIAEVVPRRLAGRASDGRQLDSLLDEPRITTLTALSRGATVPRALASGWAELEMILRTQIADAGRVADGLSTFARPGVGYVRMVQGKTCGRCAALAGKWFRSNQGFRRHPRCDCVHIPSRENVAGDLTTSPRRYFDSLDQADQNRLFGKANARAIRDGADPIPVMNASMRHGGVYTTASGRRGVSPVPEQIYQQAENRADAIRQLRLYGYIR